MIRQFAFGHLIEPVLSEVCEVIINILILQLSGLRFLSDEGGTYHWIARGKVRWDVVQLR
jgi:hypothetical protein